MNHPNHASLFQTCTHNIHVHIKTVPNTGSFTLLFIHQIFCLWVMYSITKISFLLLRGRGKKKGGVNCFSCGEGGGAVFLINTCTALIPSHCSRQFYSAEIRNGQKKKHIEQNTCAASTFVNAEENKSGKKQKQKKPLIKKTQNSRWQANSRVHEIHRHSVWPVQQVHKFAFAGEDNRCRSWEVRGSLVSAAEWREGGATSSLL